MVSSSVMLSVMFIAGGGLVEQQHIRLRRQRACDLQQALLRVGQLLGVIVRSAGKADNLQRLARVTVDLGFALLLPCIRRDNIEKRRRRLAGCGDLDVFDDAQILKDPDGLECSGQAEPRNAVRLEAKDLMAANAN